MQKYSQASHQGRGAQTDRSTYPAGGLTDVKDHLAIHEEAVALKDKEQYLAQMKSKQVNTNLKDGIDAFFEKFNDKKSPIHAIKSLTNLFYNIFFVRVEKNEKNITKKNKS